MDTQSKLHSRALGFHRSMASFIYIIFLLLLNPFLIAIATGTGEQDELQIYIVHVRPPPSEYMGTRKDWHQSFLSNPTRLLHSYSHVLCGFTARLTPQELDSLREHESFVQATPSETHQLHTTHSPSFLQLNTDPSGFWSKSAKYGEGIIVGVLDSGITPTHPSFSGTGMPAPPSKWKGACNFNDSSLCNNKLVGARSFHEGKESSMSPFDDGGHGTHTAGTAAGRFVANASVLGSAFGTAAGMAPYAHLSAYKVCWEGGCALADSVAAIDTAVGDGVDVISMSIGGSAQPLYDDPMAIAAFSAVKKGVFVAISAGNSGPESYTVHSISPWVLTVGASTTDRRIRAVVKLGNGTELEGESAYQPANISGYLPLVFPQWSEDANASLCTNVTTLQLVGVGGKAVLCQDYNIDEVEKGKIVKEAGGAAMIIWGTERSGFDTDAKAHVLPTSHVTYYDGLTIVDYMNSTADPTATIEFLGTAIGGSSDPAVAAFSSRGPSKVNNGTLKPDIIGPGVNILAAYPTSVGPFPVEPFFNTLSGTSMSCPHLAGIAALLKSSHPDWSPAMIKSALMTTTDVNNLGGGPIPDQFDRGSASFYKMGAGHVNPTRANAPGLVYDIQTDDYISYLCGLGYTDNQVSVVTSDYTIKCASHGSISEADLNYPSMVAFLDSSNSYTAKVRRTVTNVGNPNSSYTAYVVRPDGLTVDVKPGTVDFAAVGEKQTFAVSFGINATESAGASYSWRGEGWVVWISSGNEYTVRSPIVVHVNVGN